MANIFKYVTTPSGSLSGASMVKQTEDALSSISYTAETARKIVTEAESNIDAALTAAQITQAQAEASLKEIRLAVQQITGLNIPSQKGHLGEFVGTDGTRLLWQYGMRFLGAVDTVDDLPITPKLTPGTLISGNATDTELSQLQEIQNGGFNITVGGVLYEISGLDFRTISSLSDAAPILNTAVQAWGTCTYTEHVEDVEETTTLYPWMTSDGSERIYVEDPDLKRTSKLYNSDGSEYTGTDFQIVALADDAGFKVTYLNQDCVFAPSASIALKSTVQETFRNFTFTTTATGESATITSALAPSLQTVTDVSDILQISTGTATDGAVIGNVKSDVYFVVDENTVYFWNGTLWIRLGGAHSFQTVLTLEADKTSGTALTIPNGGSYLVGQKKLKVNYNGCVCYLGTNFEEVGATGTYSTTFKLLFDAKTGDEIEICIG